MPPVCWASLIGTCDSKQSEEHYVSASIVGEGTVYITGLPFCRDEVRAIPGKRLTRNMLCKRHNETLSPTDSEAGKLLRILNRFVTRAKMRSRGSDHNGDVDTYALSGSLLERWFLKTVINLTFGQPLADGSRWAPQENWVRIIFGLTPFPDDCGLYFGELIARDIPPGKSALNIQMFKEEDRVVGAQFRLNEFLFIISMVPLLLNEETRYHPDAIKEIRDGDTKQVITFAWDSPVSA